MVGNYLSPSLHEDQCKNSFSFLIVLMFIQLHFHSFFVSCSILTCFLLLMQLKVFILCVFLLCFLAVFSSNSHLTCSVLILSAWPEPVLFFVTWERLPLLKVRHPYFLWLFDLASLHGRHCFQLSQQLLHFSLHIMHLNFMHLRNTDAKFLPQEVNLCNRCNKGCFR